MKRTNKLTRPAGLRAGFAATMALSLAACGGGGGGAGPEPAPARVELALSTPEASLPSGSRQVQSLELRNSGNTNASQVIISVAPDAKLLQLALTCKGEASARCKPRADGGIEIAELRAGELITLEQVLRLEPGYSGPVGAQWSLSHAAATSPIAKRQSLQAYAADVAVAVAAPQASTSKDGQAVLSYEVTLGNLGPDEAKDVDWRLMPAPGMRWLGATCAGTAGVQCPGTLAEVMSVGRVPKGAELRLRVDYAARSSGRADTDFLSVGAALAGDSQQGNNRATRYQKDDGFGYPLVATDASGRSYDMSYALDGALGLRVRGIGVEREERLLFDITGMGFVSPRTGSNVWTPEFAALNGRAGLLLGGYDFGSGRQPFWAGSGVL